MKNLKLENLKSFIITYFLISLIFFVYQLYLSNNLTDYFCVIIMFISNLIILFYCFNKDYFFAFPISLLMIFFSHLVNIGFALFFKSFENTIVAEGLKYPLETILVLSAISLTLIFSHIIYRKSIISNNITQKIFNQLNNLKLINFENLKLLIIVSIIVILMRLFIFDLNTSGIERNNQGNFNIFQDIIKGISFFVYMPIVIFFSKLLYDNKDFKINYLFLFFFIISILFISFSSNNRSSLLDNFVIASIILFLLFIFNKIDLKKNFLKLILVIFLIVPSLNFFERLSGIYIMERSFMKERTPIQNVFSFLSSITTDPSDIISLYQENINQFFFAENYYNNEIFNRISVLQIHDNFLYIKKNISINQKYEFINLQKNKIISILPQPIINIFSDDFNKRNYVTSTASIFYKKYYDDFTSLAIGSSLISLYIILDNWIFLFCLFMFIPIFILFDSFYDKKNQIISPLIIIFFYTTGYGVLKFFASTEISNWIELPFRIIPQSILIFIILRFFTQKSSIKNTNI